VSACAQSPRRAGEAVRRSPLLLATEARCGASGAACSVAPTRHCWCVPFAVGEGRHRLWGTAVFSRGGLGVNVLGGAVPHIGAVAVAMPRPSHTRAGRRSATASVIALPGHKDDELARTMAIELARELGVTAVVTAGVHIPRARSTDIAAVLRNGSDAAKAILAHAASVEQAKRRRP
jgi:hypothetical protein